MPMLYKEILDCRLCTSSRLVPVLDLGKQALTGVFPKSRDEEVPSGPLQLCKCEDCDLVQLRHNYDLSKLYGDTYGYRSGLNQSMVRHLQQKVARILGLVKLEPDDLIVDIGSNDSNLLQAYPKNGCRLVGIDPSGPKFRKYYPDHVELIPAFFLGDVVRGRFSGKRAKVITSIAMFYDLEQPLDFVRDVTELLHDEGVWVFEQSYLSFMLDTNSYDTICHEHLEYYALKQIKYMTDRMGLRIVDIEFNDVNGGSFSVTAAKRTAPYPEAEALMARTLKQESEHALAGEPLPVYGDGLNVREWLYVLDHCAALREVLARGRPGEVYNVGGGAQMRNIDLVRTLCALLDDARPLDKWTGFTLSAESKRMAWIPARFAHGFLVISESAEMLYKATDYYAPEHERTLLWSDPALGIRWPLQGEPVVAAKDRAGTMLKDCEVYS